MSNQALCNKLKSALLLLNEVLNELPDDNDFADFESENICLIASAIADTDNVLDSLSFE